MLAHVLILTLSAVRVHNGANMGMLNKNMDIDER